MNVWMTALAVASSGVIGCSPAPSNLSQVAVTQNSSSSELERILQEIRDSKALIEQLNRKVEIVESKLEELQPTLGSSADTADAPNLEEIEIDFHSKEDAEKLISQLGVSPTAEKLAVALATIDNWISQPEKANELQVYKESQVVSLRRLIKEEVTELHKKALNATTGKTATRLHADAAQILALYPMSTAQTVLEEARNLSLKHSEVSTRIEVIRRQRYNAWAMEQIETTIEDINATASSFRTSDNPKTITATVDRLGEVDPLLLEPIVAQLYNYAVEQAKASVSSEQQLELGRKMIDTSIRRKGYGDF